MGKVLDRIDEPLAAWLAEQHVFFVATAPTGPGGHVNVSPKGYDTFRVLDERTVAYLDLTGSGVETIAHLRDNGRITLMFCAFEGPPRIVRLHGRGELVAPGDPGFEALASAFPDRAGARGVIRARLHRVSSSCGYAVPFLRFEDDRPTLDEWSERKGPDELAEYQAQKNAVSIDGLPGLADRPTPR